MKISGRGRSSGRGFISVTLLTSCLGDCSAAAAADAAVVHPRAHRKVPCRAGYSGVWSRSRGSGSATTVIGALSEKRRRPMTPHHASRRWILIVSRVQLPASLPSLPVYIA